MIDLAYNFVDRTGNVMKSFIPRTAPACNISQQTIIFASKSIPFWDWAEIIFWQGNKSEFGDFALKIDFDRNYFAETSNLQTGSVESFSKLKKMLGGEVGRDPGKPGSSQVAK
ncbi:MAG: hypothetical protein P1V20_29745 [Verrucomicrobiales bacterium]|nr:hypothetical protein [Verrucomicrobiales bacterium]